ncbi:bifunctional (p)ppGpp synthetase/guanosine-3',5'-bis(diphosphate) 3'-pyrophosphohydrolase [Desulfopila sp. IMCC35008]|uniref:bifunctional (p)ppGpp synthetase/guanosine-3',5'-bis(diphosphate) 3'-pyrophosphohydrolase n=1 Tax=Desulfopila sp. IMCC35008 TaxID=2653858 RepID=UPI0013D70EF4|nr:bifunctional (p)ppGpp synthetase/guanosine-3',5'-bis(diphosphate) 3'-pyrophosphohydrolase [Desulfopila sp. IMCC35008]
MENETSESGCQKDLLVTLQQNYTREECSFIHEALELTKDKLPEPSSLIKGVAQVLVDQKAAPDVIVAFLTAPLLWGRFIPLAVVTKKFGSNVSSLLKHFAPPQYRPGTFSSTDCTENIQALSPPLSGHTNQVLLALAIILFELQTIIIKRQQYNREKVEDILWLAVQLASKHSFRTLRRNLEDTAFNIFNPEVYNALKSQVAPLSAEDERCLVILKNTLVGLLKQNGIAADIQGRIKSLYSIHCKICHSDKSLESIMDRIGLRIIVTTVPECYRVLGLLHAHFQHIPGSFDDYIGFPKKNGYQSLHTCVYPVRGIAYKPIEFQIRTICMHKEAEYGCAAHWQYKRQEQTASTTERPQPLHNCSTSKEDFLRFLYRSCHKNNIVIFGREGLIHHLPAHSTVGQYLREAGIKVSPEDLIMVNRTLTDERYVLKDNDSVEVVWAKSRGERTAKQIHHKMAWKASSAGRLSTPARAQVNNPLSSMLVIMF